MKPNILMKIAVVLMAAFGAYAFSGNQNVNSFRVDEGEGCRDIIVACSDQGLVSCEVQTMKGVYPVWNDLQCKITVYHTEEVILPEIK